MSGESVDVVVVGGGIHGCGVLQAAAAAGHSCVLLEERGLASGTSSRSSKLIHGGLRYLESRQFALVRESLAERARLLRNAPDLVRLIPFHIPVYRSTRRRPWQIRAGLSLYALLGNLSVETRFASLPRSEWDGLDGLDAAGLQAVFRYYDAQTDDARLVRAVAHSAELLGARIESPARLMRARRVEQGWSIEYGNEQRNDSLFARTLVNAGGPWVQLVRDRIDPRPPGLEIDLVGGTHLELEGRLERGIYYAEARRDGRALFFMPWKQRILVGTTELAWRGDPRLVRPLPEEIEYLSEAFEQQFPGRRARVLDAWAGLRVLPHEPGAAFHRSRETQLCADDPHRPRTIAIYGGKLTTYRATAERVIAMLKPSLPSAARKADTATLPMDPSPLDQVDSQSSS
jgi:glycerol-3-phosphate dehydrogenase